MRIAVIKNGKVVNVVMADESWKAPKGHTVVESETASVGWDYDETSGKFIEPPVPVHEDKRDYRGKRADEYPPIGDQLDAIMKWLATESEFSVPDELKSIAMTCMSVKAKYPKPDKGEA